MHTVVSKGMQKVNHAGGEQTNGQDQKKLTAYQMPGVPADQKNSRQQDNAGKLDQRVENKIMDLAQQKKQKTGRQINCHAGLER